MTHPPGDIGRDLPPELEEPERVELARLAHRLDAGAPVPRPRFRGELKRSLQGAPRRRPSFRIAPGAARPLAAAYAGSSLLLLLLAALGLAGAGRSRPAANDGNIASLEFRLGALAMPVQEVADAAIRLASVIEEVRQDHV